MFLRLLETFGSSCGPLVGDAYSTAGAVELSDAFCAYVGSFIRNGDPHIIANALNGRWFSARLDSTAAHPA